MAAQNSNVVFNPPIEMDLGNNPGKIAFKKLSEFHEWLQNDIAFWAELDGKLTPNILPQELKGPVRTAKDQRNAFKLQGGNNVADLTDTDTIKDILQAYAEGKLIHSKSEVAAHMVGLANRHFLTELAYFYIAAAPYGLDISTAGSNGIIDFNPVLRAASHIQSHLGPASQKHTAKMNYLVDQAEKQIIRIAVHESTAVQDYEKARELLEGTDGIISRIAGLSGDLERRVSEALAPQEARIETAVKEAESEVIKVKEAFKSANATLKETLIQRIGDLQNDASERLDGFVQSAKDRLNFEVVEDYWDKKRQRHLWAWIGFGALFVVGVGAVVGGVVCYGSNYLVLIGVIDATHKPADTPFNLPLALFATLPAIGAFWVLRQILKLFLVNLAQHSDASERIAMTETFLALESEGKLSPEDRILIMQALFRPGPGSGDSDSGMPASWFDILLKRLEPGKGG